ncbi:hypothetical protein VNI00_014254 [Paramarasmius palmivorus]|uniref:Tyrosinase copper-binding domain-containing protein n=1 Tax=Paramarasmius palmivorus TaxID=297713 RepID=A0AAW0BU78_9AGAR
MLFLITVLLQLPLAFAICKKPAVRREWRALSKPERAEWIRAINCLANTPSEGNFIQYFKPNDISKYNASGSYYDGIMTLCFVMRWTDRLLDFVYIHMDLNHLIHSTGMFLPFHRWYVQVYENALKRKCGFKGVSPYWDWSLDAHDVYGSSMFKDSDPKSGLGGWGDPSNDFEVPNGGFSSFKLSYPSFHTVRRNFTLQPFVVFPPEVAGPNPARYANASFTPQEVSKLVNGFVGDYKGFQTYFESIEGAHAAVHFILGGDLAGQCPKNAPSDCVNGSPTFSANEPMFWMHHAMVDKVWFDWQQANKANTRAFEGGSMQAPPENSTQYPTGLPPNLTLKSTIHGEGMFPDAIVQDVLSTTDGMLCYVYK